MITSMEIKIKDANGYIDADWTIEDGVMIVSPKKQEKIDLTQFKAGDVLYCSHGNIQWLCIYKGEIEYMGDNIYMEDYCSLSLNGNKELFAKEDFSDSATFVRHATEEEKQELFKALADEGWEWDVKERKLVKVKWEPKVGERVYLLDGNIVLTDIFYPTVENYKEKYDCQYNLGRVFKTMEECQEYCDKLNQAIGGVKP